MIWLKARRQWVSGVSLALVLGLVVVLAMNADGSPRYEMELNDASVWVTNAEDAKMARLNSQIGQLDQGLTVAGAEYLDVLQHQHTVLINAAPALHMVDTASVDMATSLEIPAGAEVNLGRNTVAIVDPEDGRVWVRTVEALPAFSVDDAPQVRLGVGAQAVVTRGDEVIALNRVEGSVFRLTSDGADIVRLGEVDIVGEPQLSAIGDTAVVLDPGAGSVWTSSAGAIEVPELDSDARLQQPGANADAVVIASRTAMLEVSINGSGTNVTEFGGDGAPAAPLIHLGCVHAAWADPDAESYLQRCAGADDIQWPIGELATSADLRFRFNRNVVVLNDLRSGYAWLPQENMRLVRNWDDISADRERDRTETVEIGEIDPQEENRRPVLQPDFLGARPDRDTILRVLANDADPDGDLLTITSVTMDASSAEYADALQIVSEDTELQLSLPPDASGEVRFRYTASDGRPGGEASTDVVVEIRDIEVNSPPELRLGPTEVSVAAGRSVSTYILADWEDPDGDEMFVEAATAPDGGSVSFRPDGLVTYTHDGTSAGSVEIDVVVSDGRQSTTGTIDVTVLPPGAHPPHVVPDHVKAIVGESNLISPLLNDVSLDGGDLVLSSVRPSTQSSLGGSAVPMLSLDEASGTFVFQAEEEGSYFVDYTARTTGAAATSTVRVDVRPRRDDNRPPIAVTDRADVPLGGQALVDVLANDSDPDGDLLAIASVSIPDDLPIKVGVVDRRLLRIEAPIDLSDLMAAGEARFTYTVTDGQDSATAEVTVHQFRPPDQNRAPIAVDDEVTVRAGDVATIRVLDNDRDPDGDVLSLDPEGLSADDELDVIFVAGNTVRVQGPEVDRPQRFRATYEVRDPHGRSATATININVLPDDSAGNRAPQPRLVEGRAIAGKVTRIPIPMDGIDPDGDSVRFAGLVSGPQLGYVRSSGPGWMEYVAYSVSEGGGGIDEFSIALVDRYGARATVPVKVVVSPRAAENHPPVAMDDYIMVRPGRTVHVDVLANDTDADNDALTLVDADSSERGRTIISITAPEEAGQVSRRYSIWDGFGGIDSAVLTVEASPDAPLHPPVAVDDVAHPAQVAGQGPGDRILVDVLTNDYDPDGDHSDLELTSDDAQVVDGLLEIELAPQTRIVRYRIEDADGLASYGFVTVVGTDEVAPVVDPVKLDADTRATVDVGETLEIDLNEFVLVRRDHRPLVSEGGLLTSSAGEVRLVNDHTLSFDASGLEPGVVTLTAQVVDDGDPALMSVIALPVAVRNPENVPPRVERLELDLSVRDTQGILLTSDAYIDDPDAREDPRCRFAWEGDIVVQQQGEGCGVIIRPVEGAQAPTRVVIDVEVTDDSQATARGQIVVRLVERIDLTTRVRFPDFVAELGRELRVNIDDFVTDSDDRGELRLVAAGQHQVSGREIIVRPTQLGSLTVPVSLQTPGGHNISSSFRVNVGARPDAPGRPEAVRVRSGEVTLRWVAPEANGYPITSYVVEAEGMGTRRCGPTPECRLDGLSNGREYVFRVSAENELGLGASSSSSLEIRPDETPDQMPAPNIEYITDGDVGVRLTWSAPTNRGSAIVAYEIQRSDTGAVERLGPGARSWEDHSVQPGQTYRYQIRAINGTQTPQDYSPSATVTPYGTPGAPGEPRAEATTSGDRQDHRITWSAAQARGAAIEQYEVRISGRDPIFVPGDQLHADVSNLRVHQNYIVRVRAINQAGNGPWSPEITVSPSTAPLAPPAPSVTLTGDMRATVAWTYDADDFNAGSNRHFSIEIRQAGGESRELIRRVNAGDRSRNVTLGDPGVAQQIRIVAHNNRGSTRGAWSEELTPVAAPGRPSVSGSVDGNTATFTWTGPTPRGGDTWTEIRIECRTQEYLLGIPAGTRDCDESDDVDDQLEDYAAWTSYDGNSIELEGGDVRYRVHVRGVVTDPGDGARLEGNADSAAAPTSGFLPPRPGGDDGDGRPPFAGFTAPVNWTPMIVGQHNLVPFLLNQSPLQHQGHR